MSHLVELKCPSCMGRLEVLETADRAVCEFCGNVHLLLTPRAPASNSPPLEPEIVRVIRNLKEELACETNALKRIESERLTELGYGAMFHIGGAICLFLSLVMIVSHEWMALFVPLFLFACISFWVGALRIRERINPSGEEMYLREKIEELQGRLRQLTEEVEQGTLAELSVGSRS